MTGKLVAYYRVSTTGQGRSGLGLEAQTAAVEKFVGSGDWALLASFTEVESGTMNARPQLAEALKVCRMTGAALAVAKLDRLARNAKFLLTILDGAGEGGVVFCDLPSVPAGPVGRFLVTQMAAVAELEAGLISQRTRAALAATKARGKKLGGYREEAPKVNPALGLAARAERAEAFAQRLAGLVLPLREEGRSLREIATELTAKGITTPRGGDWTAGAVRAVLVRLGRA